jgi:hypothetical protein
VSADPTAGGASVNTLNTTMRPNGSTNRVPSTTTAGKSWICVTESDPFRIQLQTRAVRSATIDTGEDLSEVTG